MPFNHRMDRMVSFRLPEDEYQELRRLCEEANSRSLSDMARLAIQHWLEHGSVVTETRLEDKVLELEQRVSDLSNRAAASGSPGCPALVSSVRRTDNRSLRSRLAIVPEPRP